MEWEKENIIWNGAQLYIKQRMLTINKNTFLWSVTFVR